MDDPFKNLPGLAFMLRSPVVAMPTVSTVAAIGRLVQPPMSTVGALAPLTVRDLLGLRLNGVEELATQAARALKPWTEGIAAIALAVKPWAEAVHATIAPYADGLARLLQQRAEIEEAFGIVRLRADLQRFAALPETALAFRELNTHMQAMQAGIRELAQRAVFADEVESDRDLLGVQRELRDAAGELERLIGVETPIAAAEWEKSAPEAAVKAVLTAEVLLTNAVASARSGDTASSLLWVWYLRAWLLICGQYALVRDATLENRNFQFVALMVGLFASLQAVLPSAGPALKPATSEDAAAIGRALQELTADVVRLHESHGATGEATPAGEEPRAAEPPQGDAGSSAAAFAGPLGSFGAALRAGNVRVVAYATPLRVGASARAGAKRLLPADTMVVGPSAATVGKWRWVVAITAAGVVEGWVLKKAVSVVDLEYSISPGGC
jgi:hypothetical protein